jgi:hypothetical protein
MRFRSWIFSLAATLLTPSVACAQGHERGDSEIALFGNLGISHLESGGQENYHGELLTLGADALVRWRFLATGLGAALDSLLIFNAVEVGPLAGVWIDATPFHADLLGTVGVRSYTGWGRGVIFSDDPGTSAVLPFAGARLRLAYEIERRSTHPAYVGVVVGADDDLDRVARRYSYKNEPETCILECPDDSIVTTTRTVGGAHFAVLITIGIALPMP